MIAEPCPNCGHIGHPTRAVGIFRPGGPLGFVAATSLSDSPLRATRDEAAADVCANRSAEPEGGEGRG